MKYLLTFLTLVFLSLQVSAQKTYIWCGTLIDGVSDSPKSNMTIVVENGKISAIENGFTEAKNNDKVIDLKNRTVTPGWIDTHVHLSSESNARGYLERFQLNTADYAYRSIGNARKTIMAGFTTVRDAGGGLGVSLRNAINQGLVDGPRIYAAGITLGTTGSHGDPTNGVRDDLMGDPGVAEGVLNGPYEAMKNVRMRYKQGSDVIKIMATGGVLDVSTSGTAPQFSQEELDAIVNTANDYNLKVMAHGHGTEGINRAIKAGVASIEHGTYLDDESVRLFKEKGAYYVPTIIAGRSVADSAKAHPDYFPPLVKEKALTIGPVMSNALKKAYQGGVNIAFGTDAGVFKHGRNWLEFTYMIEAGVKPMDAIKIATINAAKLIGIEDQAGSIEPGKWADITAVDGDPLKDSNVFGKVTFVMKEGKVYKNE